MDSIASLFSSNWPSKFLKFKKHQTLDGEWEKKAIETLVKKLKSKPDALKTLEQVLEKKTANTPCITINRTQDGRMQIFHKKVFPHLVYCKMWRWPDLKNHNELKPVSKFCSKSYNMKLSEVCINPFHYEREQSTLCAASSPQFDQNFLSITNSSFSSSFNDESLADNSLENQSFNNSSNYPINESMDYSTNYSINQSMNYSIDQFTDVSLKQFYYSQEEAPLSPFTSFANSSYSTQDSCFNSKFNLEQINSVMDTNNNFQNSYQNDTQLQSYELIPQHQPSKWCSIVFHEYKNRLFEKKVTSSSHIINGFDLPKYLHKSQGLEIQNKSGQVFLNSNCKIFIQSPFLNWSNGMDLSNVIELKPSVPVKIFDEMIFKQFIKKNFQLGYVALNSLTKFTKCHLSFLFDWGYHLHIIQSPCWLELSMDFALEILDVPLSKLGSPKDQKVTSTS